MIKNNILRGEFGGYTAHHLSQCSQELTRHRASIKIDVVTLNALQKQLELLKKFGAI
jgi:hypothetical protein